MKNKTRKMIIIPVVAALMLLCAIIFIIKTRGYNDVVLSLDSLKSDNIYQFNDIKWGMSVEEVNRKLPNKLQENTARTVSSENIAFYTSKNRYLLDEQSSYASFEFNNDELKIIQFSFHLHDDYHQWFENQVKKLTELYGTESEKMENASDKMQSIGYRWDTDTTTLQLILMTGDSIKPAATLGVGLK